MTSLNTLQTKTEGHLEDLGVISFQNCEKDVFIVSISTYFSSLCSMCLLAKNKVSK